jgi:predicted 3-demethylubiquinone-9 3-methyltransferase (glyoxalase superfamily)
MPALTPMLWFDTEAEQAAEFYASVFPNSKIVEVTHYGSAGPRPEGMVMTVAFELDGQEFVALNGGPDFSFSEAISFVVYCETQEEVDTYWETLSGGGKRAPAGGSRTGSDCRGRSPRPRLRGSSSIRTRKRHSASWRPCSR